VFVGVYEREGEVGKLSNAMVCKQCQNYDIINYYGSKNWSYIGMNYTIHMVCKQCQNYNIIKLW